MIKKLLGLLIWVVAFNISAHELKTIDEIHSAYKNNKITAQQLTQGYIKRINQLNPQFNAVINIEPTAVTQAKKLMNLVLKGFGLGLFMEYPYF